MKKLLIKFWPIFIIFFLVVIFSFPYWAKGLIPFPADHLVTAFPPWQYYYGMPVKNNAIPDVVTQMYPWKHLVISLWQSGQVPLWNPYNFSGSPFLANYQSAVFHPFNFLFFVLPQIHAWSLMILFQPLLAGFFTYLFCRELRLSKAASLLSASSFMFSGFMTVWMAYGTMSHALLWLPLILYVLERAFEKISPFLLILISISLAASFFSGHFQVSFYVFLAALVFLLFKFVVTRKTKIFFICLAFVIFGILFASIQLLPTFELYQFSVRSQSLGVSEIIPWKYLVTLLAPDFYGNPVTRNDWFGHYAEWAGFLGVIPLTLAIFAFIRKKNSYIWFFTLLGVLSLALTLPTPLLDFLVKLKIPVLSSSAASRMISLFSFSAAILAGFGFEGLKEDLEKKSLKRIIPLVIETTILFMGIWWVLLINQPFAPEKLQIAKRNLILPTGMVVALFALIGVYWIFLKIFKKGKLIIHNCQFIILSLIIFLTIFDLLRFAKKWMPFDNPKHVYPNLPILEFLTKTVGPDRLFGYFGMEMQNYYRIQGFNGYDPLYIERYGELLMAASDGQIRPPSTRGVGLGRREKYTVLLLDLLGGKYVLYATADARFPWAFPFWEWPDKFKAVYRDDKYHVYQNLGAFPRAFMAYDFRVVEEPQEIVSQMFNPQTNLRKTLILEEEPGLKKQPSKAEGKVEIVKYLPQQIKLTVQTEKPGLLFLSDNYYPGWQATIDRGETKIYRADYAFRAIAVPAGSHEVEFLYDPPSFRWGTYGSLLGVVGMAGMTFILKKREESK